MLAVLVSAQPPAAAGGEVSKTTSIRRKRSGKETPEDSTTN